MSYYVCMYSMHEEIIICESPSVHKIDLQVNTAFSNYYSQYNKYYAREINNSGYLQTIDQKSVKKRKTAYTIHGAT